MPNYRLSPSDFAFLWEECKRCFYHKYVDGFKRPFGGFPAIFGTIDSEMRREYLGERTEKMSPELPPGTMTHGEKWVESGLIHVGDHAATVSIRGKLDAVVTFDDGTYGVIDFKTSSVKPYSIRLYSRQLRSYTYALENPAPKKLALSPITRMGLLAYTPYTFKADEPGHATLAGAMSWHEIKRNDSSFMGFLDEILTVLELPEAPPAGEKCAWCKYREESRSRGV